MAHANLPSVFLWNANQSRSSRSPRKFLVQPFEAAPAQLVQPSREVWAIVVLTPPKLAMPLATRDPPYPLLQLRPLRQMPRLIAIPFLRFPGLEFQPSQSPAACRPLKRPRATRLRAEGRRSSTRAAEEAQLHPVALPSR